MLLAEMFPNVHFILYDPRDFDGALYNCKNITVHQKCFGDSEDLEL